MSDSVVTCNRNARVLLVLVAAAFVVTAVWLTFHNPEIDGTSKGDNYSCLAPWDTVLNDADNIPGGERPRDSEEIGARCRNLGHERFVMAVVSALAAVLMVGLGIAVAGRRSRDGDGS